MTDDDLFIDLETRSPVDLLACGVYVYWESPASEITTVCYAFGDEPVETWFPPTTTFAGEPVPPRLLAALLDPSVRLHAHNAAFERLGLASAAGRRILAGLTIALERFYCTAARAARFGLPRSLDGVAAALDLPRRKDTAGAKVMKLLMRPTLAGTWLEADQDAAAADPFAAHIYGWYRWRQGVYCVEDVEVERDVHRVLPELNQFERDTWLMTERMNDRGVFIDDALLMSTMFMVEDATLDINQRLADATGYEPAVKQAKRKGIEASPKVGACKVTDHAGISKWLMSLGVDADFDETFAGLGMDGVGKAALAAMLEREDLPELVRSVLQMRKDGGKSSNAKYQAILSRMSPDGFVRGILVYCGAAATGRWSSRGVQMHNLPRPNLLKKSKTALQVIRDIKAGANFRDIAELYGPPILVASELLRPILVARPGKTLVRSDSKQIEARVIPWLAGAQWKLDAFQAYDDGKGPDTYKIAAGGIYNVEPDTIGDEDPRRQVGKVSDLSLGFQGGTNALQMMCKGYGVKIPAFTGDLEYGQLAPSGTDRWIVQSWRAANPENVTLWARCESTAIECMSSLPGKFFPVPGTPGMGFMRTRANGGLLTSRLPSGNKLWYWSPRLVDRMMPWGKVKTVLLYRGEDAQTHQWREFAAYGGLLAQGPTQATARDLMAWWLLRFVAADVHPVLTVHDEGIGETDLSPEEAVATTLRIMRDKPEWAGTLPVNADASAGPRYLK